MSILPKHIREFVYWLNRQKPVGHAIVNTGSFVYMHGVRMLGVKPWQDLAALTVVSHNYGFIYVGIPKIATRSFRNVLIDQPPGELKIEWSEKPGAFRDYISQYPAYNVFGFVRNPWARVVSCYNSKIADAVIGKRARIMSLYDGLHPKMSFTEFVEWLCSEAGRDAIADRHWISQHLFFQHADGTPIDAHIGHYESLESDWARICHEMGLPLITLPRLGWHSAYKAGRGTLELDYRDYYTDYTRDLVAQRYAGDIRRFGYHFGI